MLAPVRPLRSDDKLADPVWQALLAARWRGDPRALEAVPPDHPLVALYRPLLAAGPGRAFTLAHLGQSLDGFVATRDGESLFVTGAQNILHMHRLRALCDAVVVGAATVAADDSRLTTRLVEGPNPLRVVLDARRRLPARMRIFDAAAPTLLLCTEDAARAGERFGAAEVLGVRADGDGLDPGAVLDALHARGCRTVFVEGGGRVVSAFLRAGRLDRLQITVAPVVIGSGRPGLQLPAGTPLGACLRPAHRTFRMGDDVMFDCDLRAAGGPAPRDRLYALD